MVVEDQIVIGGQVLLVEHMVVLDGLVPGESSKSHRLAGLEGITVFRDEIQMVLESEEEQFKGDWAHLPGAVSRVGDDRVISTRVGSEGTRSGTD